MAVTFALLASLVHGPHRVHGAGLPLHRQGQREARSDGELPEIGSYTPVLVLALRSAGIATVLQCWPWPEACPPPFAGSSRRKGTTKPSHPARYRWRRDRSRPPSRALGRWSRLPWPAVTVRLSEETSSREQIRAWPYGRHERRRRPAGLMGGAAWPCVVSGASKAKAASDEIVVALGAQPWTTWPRGVVTPRQRSVAVQIQAGP